MREKLAARGTSKPASSTRVSGICKLPKRRRHSLSYRRRTSLTTASIGTRVWDNFSSLSNKLFMVIATISWRSISETKACATGCSDIIPISLTAFDHVLIIECFRAGRTFRGGLTLFPGPLNVILTNVLQRPSSIDPSACTTLAREILTLFIFSVAREGARGQKKESQY